MTSDFFVSSGRSLRRHLRNWSIASESVMSAWLRFNSRLFTTVVARVDRLSRTVPAKQNQRSHPCVSISVAERAKKTVRSNGH